MKKEQIISLIGFCIQHNMTCKIYWKDFERSPMYGIFVETGDSKDMALKGMYRFVSVAKIDSFIVDRHVMLTKLIDVSALSQIRVACSVEERPV